MFGILKLMIVRKAFKFQLQVQPEQVRLLSQASGCSRYVWNRALALQKEQLDAGQSCLSYRELAALLVSWKHEHGTAFLADVAAQPLQQTLMHLDRALKDAFNKTSPKQFPRYKKKGQHDSFRYPQGFKLDGANGRIYLPKIGWVRYRKSQAITGTPKNVTVSRSCGRWYVAIQTEEEVDMPVHPSDTDVGVDVGIAKFATLSTGKPYDPIHALKRCERKLASLQQALSRKQKFSNNWQKQKAKIAKLHQSIARKRQDHLHKTSTEISKNHAMVVIEDLQVSNMSRSARGTQEAPGKNVRAKAGLNKSILDQGWGEFRRQLEYKQQWRGGILVAVPPQHTSQRCSACGHVAPENRPTQARFHCQQCGYMDNADVNAAKNILAAGHAVLACGGSGVSRPMKQEPTEGAA